MTDAGDALVTIDIATELWAGVLGDLESESVTAAQDGDEATSDFARNIIEGAIASQTATSRTAISLTGTEWLFTLEVIERWLAVYDEIGDIEGAASGRRALAVLRPAIDVAMADVRMDIQQVAQPPRPREIDPSRPKSHEVRRVTLSVPPNFWAFVVDALRTLAMTSQEDDLPALDANAILEAASGARQSSRDDETVVSLTLDQWLYIARVARYLLLVHERAGEREPAYIRARTVAEFLAAELPGTESAQDL